MAQKLEDFDFRLNTQRGSHDWDRLLDGSIWRLVQGDDFNCTTESMRKMVYQRAWKKGGSAHTDMSEKGILVIQYYEKDEEKTEDDQPLARDEASPDVVESFEADAPIPDEFADLVDDPANDAWPDDD